MSKLYEYWEKNKTSDVDQRDFKSYWACALLKILLQGSQTIFKDFWLKIWAETVDHLLFMLFYLTRQLMLINSLVKNPYIRHKLDLAMSGT